MQTRASKRRIRYLTIGIPLIILIVLYRSKPLDEKRENDKNNFTLRLKGVLVHRTTLDHNDAFVKLLVTDSNGKNFEGKDWLGRDIRISGDTAELTLMREDCLSIGDTILFGPKSNYQIKRGSIVVFDLEQGIDNCK